MRWENVSQAKFPFVLDIDIFILGFGYYTENGENVFSKEETQAEVSDAGEDKEAFIPVTTNSLFG